MRGIIKPPAGHTDWQVVNGFMSLIGCTSDCLYQKDGYCQLDKAMSSGDPSAEHPCVNYVPKSLQNSGQSLPNTTYLNEL